MSFTIVSRVDLLLADIPCIYLFAGEGYTAAGIWSKRTGAVGSTKSAWRGLGSSLYCVALSVWRISITIDLMKLLPVAGNFKE